MHLVVSGCDASPSTSYPRLLSTPRAVSGNGSGSSFSFFFNSFRFKNICKPFLMHTLGFQARFCTEAALYLCYLELGFLHSPKFCCCWPLTFVRDQSFCFLE